MLGTVPYLVVSVNKHYHQYRRQAIATGNEQNEQVGWSAAAAAGMSAGGVRSGSYAIKSIYILICRKMKEFIEMRLEKTHGDLDRSTFVTLIHRLCELKGSMCACTVYDAVL